MKIIKPSYQILSDIDGPEILLAIERAGRTCYKSEDKITYDSAQSFIEMLISRGHESVLEHCSLSVLFICDRGVSHEIVRHRLASFSQESTRYCNYSNDKFGKQITVICPDFGENGDDIISEEEITWEKAMRMSEQYYFKLLKLGCSPQIARSVLPNSLKTEIVVTANLREWRTIFKQRTSKAAHPQMRELMVPLFNEFKFFLPAVFNDIIITK